MLDPKKDESIKTGLQIQAHNVTKKSSEKDAAWDPEKDNDELAHAIIDIPEDISVKDPDELVHEQPSTSVVNEDEEKDPDDLVHEKGFGETEES